MKGPDPEIQQKDAQWLAYADEDLRMAKHSLGMPDAEPPYRLIAYHAQQCVEKHLKAFLVRHCKDFPYTHNISTLLEVCGDLGDWPETMEEAEELTPYAVTARYPGENDEVTQKEALQAIEIAQRVRLQVRTQLGQK